jgi:hypothetical protein
MKSIRSLASLTIVPVLGAVFLAAGGCGEREYPVDPEGGARLKQARIAAYGPSGAPKTTKGANVSGGGVSSGGTQAAARQKAQGGR